MSFGAWSNNRNMEYIGKIENDKKLYRDTQGIIVFGAGNSIDKLLNELEKMHLKGRVKYICDNNCEKQGKEISGIKIVNPQYVFNYYRNSDYIVYNQFCVEICKQLLEEGIKKVHLIRS